MPLSLSGLCKLPAICNELGQAAVLHCMLLLALSPLAEVFMAPLNSRFL